MLAEGAYTIVLIGRNFTFYDTLHIPLQAPDSIFEFRITVVEMSTHQPVPNTPVELWIDDTIPVNLHDRTDMAGTTSITYSTDFTDILNYHVLVEHPGWPGYFGQTKAVKGIPEVITLGISGEF